MEIQDTKELEYTKPEITDHGDLTELTAGLKTGSSTDAAYPVHTPLKDELFVSGP